MNDIEKFNKETVERINKIGSNERLKKIAYDFQHETGKYGYLYNFRWLGLPIIQYPQDMVALQEIVYRIKPDLIVEAGVARGGSLIFNASSVIYNGLKVSIMTASSSVFCLPIDSSYFPGCGP